MNLKEAFRYQNKLQSFMDESMSILKNPSNTTKVETTYLRSKVMSEAEDETVVSTPETDYYEDITVISDFLLYLLAEKEKLTAAIRQAKSALEIDLDGQVSLNAERQRIARVFREMNDLRGSQQVISNGGSGFRFNSDGNQVTYRCDAKRVTTINFDRNVIRRKLKALDREADDMSARLDICLVTSNVEYQTPFDVNASFADAFEDYKAANKKQGAETSKE